MHNKIYRCDPDKNVECDKKTCYRHLRDKSGYFPCYSTTNKKYKMKLGKRIQEYRRDHLTCVQFDKYLKGLDTKKFHINRTMIFNVAESKFYVGDWAIFRQDMTTEKYFSPTNEAILDSDHNTVKDIRKLYKKEVKEYQEGITYIFLDVDGVLNNKKHYQKMHKKYGRTLLL